MKNRNFKFYLILVATLAIGSAMQAQVKIGNNPTAVNRDAVLELESTNQGLLLPRVALTSTSVATPLSAHVAGMVVYNTATTGNVTPGFYYNNGTQWISTTAGAVATALTTADVPDTTDKRYQSDDQFLFNDATSSIQTQLDGKQAKLVTGNASQYIKGDLTLGTLDKIAIGLSNVDNTSDANKPISTAQQTALNLKADQTALVATNVNVATNATNIATNTTAIAAKANIDNQTFTGNMVLSATTTATTLAQANNSDAVATTKYVDTAVAALSLTHSAPVTEDVTGQAFPITLSGLPMVDSHKMFINGTRVNPAALTVNTTTGVVTYNSGNNYGYTIVPTDKVIIDYLKQ
jgi:hypothetical protein